MALIILLIEQTHLCILNLAHLSRCCGGFRGRFCVLFGNKIMICHENAYENEKTAVSKLLSAFLVRIWCKIIYNYKKSADFVGAIL